MAANHERGEVDMVVGDRTYALRPTMNALCQLQKRTGLTYQQTLASLSTLDLTNLRELIFALLQPNYSKEIKTLEQVGDVIDAAGGLNAILLVMTELIRVNQQRGNGVLGEASGDPQAAQVGTGASSGETAGASA